MTDYVLVHGAWTGGHSWRGTAERLTSLGHRAITPTLAGLGERYADASVEVDLNLHAQEITQLLRSRDLHRVVLVGHSYGGVVACQAADRAADRIARLVLVDSLLPRDGQSIDDLRRRPTAPGDDWIAPPGLHDADAARLKALLALGRVSMQPARTFRQPLALTAPIEERAFARCYIRAARRPRSAAYTAAARHAQLDPAWDYREIDAGHLGVLARPEGLASILVDPAGEPGRLNPVDRPREGEDGEDETRLGGPAERSGRPGGAVQPGRIPGDRGGVLG